MINVDKVMNPTLEKKLKALSEKNPSYYSEQPYFDIVTANFKLLCSKIKNDHTNQNVITEQMINAAIKEVMLQFKINCCIARYYEKKVCKTKHYGKFICCGCTLMNIIYICAWFAYD